ncbi:MAG: hypothetical protein JXN61_08430, partial [Sedimentisphaerales bacterium]|nr:hypothetical protein [Sedimentisphaerales bacterium]
MARRFSLRRLSAALRSLKIGDLIGRLDLRELTNRLRLFIATCRFTAFIQSLRSRFVAEANSISPLDAPLQPDMAGLNCRVCIGPGGKDASSGDSLV